MENIEEILLPKFNNGSADFISLPNEISSFEKFLISLPTSRRYLDLDHALICIQEELSKLKILFPNLKTLALLCSEPSLYLFGDKKEKVLFQIAKEVQEFFPNKLVFNNEQVEFFGIILPYLSPTELLLRLSDSPNQSLSLIARERIISLIDEEYDYIRNPYDNSELRFSIRLPLVKLKILKERQTILNVLFNKTELEPELANLKEVSSQTRSSLVSQIEGMEPRVFDEHLLDFIETCIGDVGSSIENILNEFLKSIEDHQAFVELSRSILKLSENVSFQMNMLLSTIGSLVEFGHSKEVLLECATKIYDHLNLKCGRPYGELFLCSFPAAIFDFNLGMLASKEDIHFDSQIVEVIEGFKKILSYVLNELVVRTSSLKWTSADLLQLALSFDNPLRSLACVGLLDFDQVFKDFASKELLMEDSILFAEDSIDSSSFLERQALVSGWLVKLDQAYFKNFICSLDPNSSID